MHPKHPTISHFLLNLTAARSEYTHCLVGQCSVQCPATTQHPSVYCRPLPPSRPRSLPAPAPAPPRRPEPPFAMLRPVRVRAAVLRDGRASPVQCAGGWTKHAHASLHSRQHRVRTMASCRTRLTRYRLPAARDAWPSRPAPGCLLMSLTNRLVTTGIQTDNWSHVPCSTP